MSAKANTAATVKPAEPEPDPQALLRKLEALRQEAEASLPKAEIGAERDWVLSLS